MNRDDIIRMAREADLPIAWITETGVLKWSELESFAALVYEHTWKEAGIAATRTVLDAAVLAEREACATFADLVAREIDDTNSIATYIAKGIRARENV